MPIKKFVRHRNGYGSGTQFRTVSSDPVEDYQIRPYFTNEDSETMLNNEVPHDDQDFAYLGRGERDHTYIGDDVPPRQ